MGKRMQERIQEIEQILETRLRTHQPFNLKELAENVDLPVDVKKAVSAYKLNRLRKIAYDVGRRVGLRVFCDGDCNIIVASTREEIQKAIASKQSQLIGRAQELLFYVDMEQKIRSQSRRRSTDEMPEGQRTLGDMAVDDDHAELAKLLPENKRAPVVALRAKDDDGTRRTLMTVLVADPKAMEDFGIAASTFYRQAYGIEVAPALFSEGVIPPADLEQLWRQIVPGLRRLAQQPDLMRQQATGGEASQLMH